jgi:hypothetical protein
MKAARPEKREAWSAPARRKIAPGPARQVDTLRGMQAMYVYCHPCGSLDNELSCIHNLLLHMQTMHVTGQDASEHCIRTVCMHATKSTAVVQVQCYVQ